MLEIQASEIEEELEREDRMAKDAEHDAHQGAESEREEEGDDQEAAEASTTPESEGKGKAEGGGSSDIEDKTARSGAAAEGENGGEEKDMNESGKEKEAEKSESEETHGLTTTEGERPEPVSAETNQEKSERESENEAGEKVEPTPPVVARSLEGEEHWATEQHVKEKEEEMQQQQGEAQEKSVTTDDEEQRVSDDDLPTPAMESKGDERKRLFSDELNHASEASNGEMTVALSLCGDILPNTASEVLTHTHTHTTHPALPHCGRVGERLAHTRNVYDLQLAERVFEEHRLSSEEFWKDPSGAMADARLVVRIRDKYALTACVVSWADTQPLTRRAVDLLGWLQGVFGQGGRCVDCFTPCLRAVGHRRGGQGAQPDPQGQGPGLDQGRPRACDAHPIVFFVALVVVLEHRAHGTPPRRYTRVQPAKD